jgi:hypothetical protein
MPSTSKAQHNLMAAVAHNPSFAKKVGIPQSVGKDFNNADKSKKFSKGGDMATKPKIDPRMVAAMIAAKRRPAAAPDMGAPAPAMAQAPMPPQQGMGGMAPTPGMKKGGNMKKMAKGGETMGPRSMKEDVEKNSNKHSKFGESKLQKRGHTKDIEEKMAGSTTGMKRGGKTVKKMASGGSASSRADGIASKGKTKGKFI